MRISSMNNYASSLYVNRQNQINQNKSINTLNLNNSVNFTGKKSTKDEITEDIVTALIYLGGVGAISAGVLGCAEKNQKEKEAKIEVLKVQEAQEMHRKAEEAQRRAEDAVRIIPSGHQQAILNSYMQNNGITYADITPMYCLTNDNKRVMMDFETQKELLTQKSSTHFVDNSGNTYKIESTANGGFKVVSDIHNERNNLMVVERQFDSEGVELKEKYKEHEYRTSDETRAISLVNGLQKFEGFKNFDKNAFINITAKMGLSNLEVIERNKGNYNLFFDTKKNTYDVNIKKLDNQNSFVGTAAKLTPDGDSDLYLFKMEFLSTDKSNKIRISHMNIVQDGLEEDSPTTKKGIQETKEFGGETTTSSQNIDGKSRKNMLIPGIPNIFHPGHNFDGNITNETAKQIDKLITLTNSDGKEVVIYSCPKGRAGVKDVSVRGDAIE